MDNLTYIGNSADDAGLPWAREYYQQTRSEDPSQVYACKHTDKGLFITAMHFKGYAWKNSRLYDSIVATLHMLAMHPDMACPMYAKALRGGNLAIAIDETAAGSGTWTKEDDAWRWQDAETIPADSTQTPTLLSPEFLMQLREKPASASALGNPHPKVEGAPPTKVKKPPTTPK